MGPRRVMRGLDRLGGIVVQVVFALGFLVVGTFAALLLGAGFWAPVWGLLAMVVLTLVITFFPASDQESIISDVSDPHDLA